MFPLSAAHCRARLALFGGQSTDDVEVRLGWGTPSNQSRKKLRFQVPDHRVQRRCDAAHLIPRSVLTPAQAGITWGVPVARAVRVADSGGRGSRSLGWREDVGPRENSKGRSAREVVEAGHESWFEQVSGRVAHACAGRVSQATKISLEFP